MIEGAQNVCSKHQGCVVSLVMALDHCRNDITSVSPSLNTNFHASPRD